MLSDSFLWNHRTLPSCISKWYCPFWWREWPPTVSNIEWCPLLVSSLIQAAMLMAWRGFTWRVRRSIKTQHQNILSNRSVYGRDIACFTHGGRFKTEKNLQGREKFLHFEFGPGGDSAYERGGDARRKLWIKPLKETNLGVAQAFFWPLKETMLRHRQYIFFYIFSRATLNETFTAKYDGVLPRTP